MYRRLKKRKAVREGRRPETGDEIWLHVKPEEGRLEEFGRRKEAGEAGQRKEEDAPAVGSESMQEGVRSEGAG